MGDDTAALISSSFLRHIQYLVICNLKRSPYLVSLTHEQLFQLWVDRPSWNASYKAFTTLNVILHKHLPCLHVSKLFFSCFYKIMCREQTAHYCKKKRSLFSFILTVFWNSPTIHIFIVYVRVHIYCYRTTRSSFMCVCIYIAIEVQESGSNFV